MELCSMKTVKWPCMVLHNPSVCEIFADIRGWIKFENKYGYVASSYKCQLPKVNTYVLALLVQTETCSDLTHVEDLVQNHFCRQKTTYSFIILSINLASVSFHVSKGLQSSEKLRKIHWGSLKRTRKIKREIRPLRPRGLTQQPRLHARAWGGVAVGGVFTLQYIQ